MFGDGGCRVEGLAERGEEEMGGGGEGGTSVPGSGATNKTMTF